LFPNPTCTLCQSRSSFVNRTKQKKKKKIVADYPFARERITTLSAAQSQGTQEKYLNGMRIFPATGTGAHAVAVPRLRIGLAGANLLSGIPGLAFRACGGEALAIGAQSPYSDPPGESAMQPFNALGRVHPTADSQVRT
jgi:hypothetical protein